MTDIKAENVKFANEVIQCLKNQISCIERYIEGEVLVVETASHVQKYDVMTPARPNHFTMNAHSKFSIFGDVGLKMDDFFWTMFPDITCIAMDDCGEWYGYICNEKEVRPDTDDLVWFGDDFSFQVEFASIPISKNIFPKIVNWKYSKIVRPDGI